MPKETIKTGQDPKPTTVHVGWDRSGYVQIATTGWYLGAEDDAPEVGIYADLNRDQINKLIRNLRRARDQAFGADE